MAAQQAVLAVESREAPKFGTPPEVAALPARVLLKHGGPVPDVTFVPDPHQHGRTVVVSHWHAGDSKVQAAGAAGATELPVEADKMQGVPLRLPGHIGCGQDRRAAMTIRRRRISDAEQHHGDDRNMREEKEEMDWDADGPVQLSDTPVMM
jgi:hypothetical protein